MSLPEIIPSNLPVFVQNKNRSSFANSVIPSGAVLLFAESDGQGGSKLIAKNPDGSFSEVGDGSSMNFYKCASVGTGTWTGYLATIDSTTGVWSFASTATTGLTYERITPVVESVYDENCTFKVSSYKTALPEDGLVYYHDCDSLSITDRCGNSLTYNQGDIAIENDPSIGKNIINLKAGTVTTLLSNDYSATDFSVSTWMKKSLDSKTAWTICLVSVDNINNTYRFELPAYRVSNSGGVVTEILTNATLSNWNHFVFLRSGSTVYLYLNGTFVGSSIMSSYPSGNVKYFCLGSNEPDSTNIDGTAKFANVRLYNRVLTSEEISALANEFTPTAS